MKFILAVLLPPVACLVAGKPKQALINIPLTFLLWIPGVIHAIRTVRSTKGEGVSSETRIQYSIQSSRERQRNDQLISKAVEFSKSAERNRKTGNVKKAEEKYWKSIKKWKEYKGCPAPAPFRELAKLYYHTGFSEKAIEVLDLYLDPRYWPKDFIERDGTVKNEEIELLKEHFDKGKFRQLEGKYKEKPTANYPLP